MPRTFLALAAVALAGSPNGVAAKEVFLAEQLVFPPGEAAFAGTLDRPLRELWPRGFRPRPGELSILVHKAGRRLDLLADGRIAKSYVVNLGLAPTGDKEKQGDFRTPEGELFVCSKNARSRFTRFLALAYPSPAHVARAALARRASAAIDRAVRNAYLRRDRCPPQGTAMGGAVGIHGSGGWARSPGGFLVVDWTWGCIGLRDADILELFDVVQVGTPVRILAE